MLPLDWLNSARGQGYDGELVTQLEHALQTAALAQQAGAGPALVLAALFHDLGHVVPAEVGPTEPAERSHERLGARQLHRFFPPEVSEPVRLHVLAKRFLARDPAYRARLSAESERTLGFQGGPLSEAEAEGFLGLPHAESALALRGWCDAAKVPGREVPSLESYRALAEGLARPKLVPNV